MPHHRTQDGPDEHARVERAIVLQLLSSDHHERWTPTELQAELDHVEPSILTDALERLKRDGVLVAQDDTVLASPCARRLDGLGLIAI